MTKSELILRLAELNPHLYQRDVERIVTTIFEEVIDWSASVCRGAFAPPAPLVLEIGMVSRHYAKAAPDSQARELSGFEKGRSAARLAVLWALAT